MMGRIDLRQMLIFMARGVAYALGSVAYALSRRFPTDQELALRVMFGELTPAEAERRAGHFVCGRHIPDLESQNAIRRALRVVQVEEPSGQALQDRIQQNLG